MRICVFGAASDAIDKKYVDDCFILGETLAKRGHDLVFGAGGVGLMGATAKGFKKGGAHIIGVIPQFFEDNGYESVYKEADAVFKTETMAERKSLMEKYAEAFLIVAGSIGTFEEFFEVMTLKQLGRHKKPIIVYNFNGFYDWLNDLLKNLADGGFLNKEALKMCLITDDKDEIIRYIDNYSEKDCNWNILKPSEPKN